MTVKSHYEQHLGHHYTWLYGGFDINIEINKKFFKEHSINPKTTRVAIDLGAGSGFQSIPLAKAGFNVIAIDFSKRLLDELRSRSNGLSIDIIKGDILDFRTYGNTNPELVVCMGDTLTHISDLNSVYDLIKNSYEILSESGTFILTFRDLTLELKEEDRFIPVRSDDNKIFMCFLEYETEYVKIFDIIYEKENGKWDQKISSYKKIKISQETIEQYIKDAGFNIEFFDVKNGLVTLIVKK